jgi:hypothetical protein
MKAASLSFFIDFRAAQTVATGDNVDGSFFAAFKLAQDLVHNTVVNQRLKSFRDFHIATVILHSNEGIRLNFT